MNGSSKHAAGAAVSNQDSQHEGPAGAANDKVSPKGGPPASTFSWGSLTCRLIILIVWGVTPLSWTYVTWYCYTQLQASDRPRDGSSISSALLKHGLFAYCLVEALFSIYYRFLVYRAQTRTPLPRYSRAFLRQTLARALEDGMKQESAPSTISNGNASLGADLDVSKLDNQTRRPRRATFSKASFSKLSFLDEANKLAYDDPRAADWRNMFSAWFLGTPWEELKRGNVAEWLSWSFFGMHYEEILDEHRKEGYPPIPERVQTAEDVLDENESDEQSGAKLSLVHHGLYMLEARSGMTLPEGKNPAVRSIRLHLDPVKATSRPLAKYLVTGLFNILLERRTARAGFVRHRTSGLEYLIRVPEKWEAGSAITRPVFFLHGLGMGLAQYASLVSYFEQHPSLQDRPLVLLVQPHLSMSLFHPNHLQPPNKDSTTQALRDLVKGWGFSNGITVVSHSNGTIVHGWLLKECPELIKASAFVDPVTFCLWEPYVAYNFLYKPPITGIEHLMRYFVGEEIGIAVMLQRFFDWSANILWFEEVPNALDPRATAFFLAEKDSILNARRVERYLRDHGVRSVDEGGNLRFMHGLAHGEALITGQSQVKMLMDWLSNST